MACQQTRVTPGHLKRRSFESFSQIWMKIKSKKVSWNETLGVGGGNNEENKMTFGQNV
jgi:hypothetical protein